MLETNIAQAATHSHILTGNALIEILAINNIRQPPQMHPNAHTENNFMR